MLLLKPSKGADAGANLAPALRRPYRRVVRLAAGPLLLLMALSLWIGSVWPQTARREAYLPQLEAQARRDPDNGPLMALLGARLVEAHQQAAATTALRRAAADGERRELVWQCLAAAVASTGDRARALADLRLGRRVLGAAPELDAALARAEALGPNPAPALLAQNIAPDGPTPLAALYTQGSPLNGLVSWWGHHFPEQSGFTTRQEWARQQPRNAQALRLWGLALMENERTAEAGAVLLATVPLAPHSAAAHLALAQALDQVGQTGKAGPEYLAALRLHPDWLPALLGLGHNSLHAGLDYAVQAFRRAVQVAPDSAEAQMGLGSAALENGPDLATALTSFQAAARLAPGETVFYVDYAEALRKSHRLDEAEAILRKRLSAAPGDALCHYRLGGVLTEDNPTPARLAEAEAQTRTALSLAPYAAVAEIQLGQLLLGDGRPAEAVQALKRALVDDPNDVHGLNCLSRAYARNGQERLSQETSARARTVFDGQQRVRVLEGRKFQNPMDLSLHVQLADLYARLGEPDKAVQERRMLTLLKTNPAGTARSISDFNTSVAQTLGTRG